MLNKTAEAATLTGVSDLNTFATEQSKDTLYFSYFNAPIKNIIPDRNTNLSDLHKEILSDKHKRITQKLRSLTKAEATMCKGMELDYITPSGTFVKRDNKSLIQHSNLFCVDIDHLGTGDALTDLQQQLRSILEPALMFVSPSGDGLKAVFQIDISQAGHKDFFAALLIFFKSELNIEIDKSCSDVSRATYLCHDPECFYSETPTILGRAFVDKYKIEPVKVKEPETQTEPTPDSQGTALDIICAMVRGAKDGEKHTKIRDAARLAGGYIKAGHIAEEQAYKTLKEEVDKKKTIVDFEAAYKTIHDGIEFGKVNPIDPKVTNNGIIEISPKEFAFDVFKFERKGETIYLAGLYRNGMIDRLTDFGYCKRFLANNTYQFIKQKDNVLDEVQPTLMKDEIMDYLHGNYSEILQFDYKGITVKVTPEKLIETFLNQSHLIFNEKFLEHLPTHSKPILKDTKTKAFFPFQNTIVRVTKDEVRQIDYSELKEFAIWRKHILKKSFNEVNSDISEFEQFIKNVSGNSLEDEGNEDRFKAFVSAIGYLLHNYNNLTKGQAVLAYDEQITDLKEPQGGTGKGIIQQALKQLRQVVKIDGKKFNEDDRFCFQDIDELTQIAFFDDVKADLGFDRFHSILTEGWNIEKKNKQATYILPENSPKVYITSNAIIKGEGSTNERRQFIIEFSPFYRRLIRKKLEPIIYTHGSEFFSTDWNVDEWNRFYSFMLGCCQSYLANGLHNYKYVGLNQNKLRQYTSEEFCEWIKQRAFIVDTEYNLSNEYHDFKLTYYGEASDFKQRTFSVWLKQYANNELVDLKTKRANGVTTFKLVNKSTESH